MLIKCGLCLKVILDVNETHFYFNNYVFQISIGLYQMLLPLLTALAVECLTCITWSRRINRSKTEDVAFH